MSKQSSMCIQIYRMQTFLQSILNIQLNLRSMQTLKNLFAKKQPQTIPSLKQTFDHSKISASDDISECPFMKNKNQQQNKVDENAQKSDQEKCPYKGKNQAKNKKNKGTEAESSSDEQEIPKGGCPFMGSSQKKRNPNLYQIASGYDVPFVSKFHFYLSPNKIDFTLLKQKKSIQPITRSREIFNTYPIYLQHTLFFNGQDYKKVRGIECCSRFLPYEKLREKGNKYFNKGQYAEALDYYERALSLFKWLQYFEEDVEKSFSNVPSYQSLGSSQNLSVNPGSKVRISLNNTDDQQENFQKDDELDEMRTKYKEFFVVYTDGNVKLCDGEEMEDAPDIDMRKSLMLQVLLNMAVTYCHMNHFSVALQCIEDCLKLSDKVSQVYLRKAQVLIFNKGHSLEEVEEAKKCMEKALQLKASQKIFQSNQNILKMVNLHNATENYQNTFNLINQSISEKQKQIQAIRERIYERAKQINQVQKRLLQEGKTPYERNEESMQESKQFKILLRMKQKYVKVIEFYTEAQNKEQVGLAKKQIQELIRVFADMKTIINISIEEKKDELGGVYTEKIQKRIKTIKKNYCEDIYNAGKFNFTVLEWAIKEIIKEERQIEELKKKADEAERRANGEDVPLEKDGKNDFLKKASWVLVLIPIAGILINHFLMI